MEARLRTRWAQIEKDFIGSPDRKFISPILYGQHAITLPLILKYAKGELIDLGCGWTPFKAQILSQVQRYDSLDLYPRNPADVTFVADIQDMGVIPDHRYDTALCIEVLEHVQDPFRACREIYRVVKPGGHVILTVPHLSRLHDEPHDYYRFTQYGIRRILEQADFHVVDIQARGGFLSFVGHQISTVLLSLTWNTPLLKQVAWVFNRFFISQACFYVDHHLIHDAKFVQGYTAVAQKRNPNEICKLVA